MVQLWSRVKVCRRGTQSPSGPPGALHGRDKITQFVNARNHTLTIATKPNTKQVNTNSTAGTRNRKPLFVEDSTLVVQVGNPVKAMQQWQFRSPTYLHSGAGELQIAMYLSVHLDD